MSRTTAVTDWPLLTRGSREHPTVTLQYLLRANGHNVALNGIFGMTVERAVRAFQKRKHLAVDGSVGPKTWAELIVVVQRANRGVAVCAVQNEFNLRQVAGTTVGLAVDGVFGPETDRAVRAFQADAGLVVDGVVGSKTWAALADGVLLG
ncbi:MAG: peptidoglycan-binding domain-containing protein [Solirubrobacteraceae bacterium]